MGAISAAGSSSREKQTVIGADHRTHMDTGLLEHTIENCLAGGINP
jgi:hypothetical protein